MTNLEKVEKNITIVLMIINIIFTFFNYKQSKTTNDLSRTAYLKQTEIDMAKLNLESLEGYVEQLQNYKQSIDKFDKENDLDRIPQVVVEEIDNGTQKIFNSYKLKLNKNNSNCEVLDTEIAKHIRLIEEKVYDVKKKLGYTDNQMRDMLVYTGYSPELEEAYLLYKVEEIELLSKIVVED